MKPVCLLCNQPTCNTVFQEYMLNYGVLLMLRGKMLHPVPIFYKNKFNLILNSK